MLYLEYPHPLTYRSGKFKTQSYTFKFESLNSLPIPTAHLYINANNLTILILPTGTGAIVGSIKNPSRKEPIIVGKPNSVMFDLLKKEHNLDPSRCMMVSDRLV
jgi:ribonucleotide monophosphatase NagD (HAD superfamily)